MPSSRIAILVLTCLASAPAAAQPVLDFREELEAERPEAWALRWLAAALSPAGSGAPERLAAGGFEVGVELSSLPHLSESQRTVGFNGTKTEDLNRSPLYGRPSVSIGLGAGFVATAGWIPPVEVDGMRPDVVSLALSRPLLERGRFRLGAALGRLEGSVAGDVTCDAASAAAGDDPVRNPFGCEAPSDDELRLRGWSLELAATWALDAVRRWAVHLGVSARDLDAELRVDARYAGLIDRSVLAYEGRDWTFAGGVSRRAGERLRFAFDLAYAPLDVVRDPFGDGERESDPLLQARLRIAWRVR